MIVLTYVRDDVHKTLFPGDTFNLVISDATGYELMISEEITTEQEITYIATYRFALEDGTVSHFHLAGIFGSKYNLPREIKEAVHFNDLSEVQKERFRATCGFHQG